MMSKTDTLTLMASLANLKTKVKQLTTEKADVQKQLKKTQADLKRSDFELQWERTRRIELEGTVESMQCRLRAAGLSLRHGRVPR